MHKGYDILVLQGLLAFGQHVEKWILLWRSRLDEASVISWDEKKQTDRVIGIKITNEGGLEIAVIWEFCWWKVGFMGQFMQISLECVGSLN